MQQTSNQPQSRTGLDLAQQLGAPRYSANCSPWPRPKSWGPDRRLLLLPLQYPPASGITEEEGDDIIPLVQCSQTPINYASLGEENKGLLESQQRKYMVPPGFLGLQMKAMETPLDSFQSSLVSVQTHLISILWHSTTTKSPVLHFNRNPPNILGIIYTHVLRIKFQVMVLITEKLAADWRRNTKYTNLEISLQISSFVHIIEPSYLHILGWLGRVIRIS